MNVLFIGPYRQVDEWGRKSRSLLQAIKNAGHSVTSRPIFLAPHPNFNSYLEMCEFNTSNDYDVLIQFLLQPYAIYEGSFAKRVGIFNTETIPRNLPLSSLTKELLMDEIWTDSVLLKNSLQSSLDNYGGNVSVRAIPPLLDTSDLPADEPFLSIRGSDPEIRDRFIFYYIGNIAEEKSGFKEACVAFLSTFSKSDSVALVATPEVPIADEHIDQIMGECRTLVGQSKNAIHHPLIKVIRPQNGILQTSERIALHKECDCMVAPHYSLSMNSLVLEAALYGNAPIVNKGNACYEWWKDDRGVWGIDSYEEICFTNERPLPYRFTSEESWHKPIVKSIGDVMQVAYVDKFNRDKKIKKNSELREYFNGPVLQEILQ